MCIAADDSYLISKVSVACLLEDLVSNMKSFPKASFLQKKQVNEKMRIAADFYLISKDFYIIRKNAHFHCYSYLISKVSVACLRSWAWQASISLVSTAGRVPRL